MIIGEILNFLAYFFAPAVVIAPLGSLSILTTFFFNIYRIILGKIMLLERISRVQKLGCAAIVLGTTILLITTPNVDDDIPISELRSKIFSVCNFLYYRFYMLWCSCSNFCRFFDENGFNPKIPPNDDPLFINLFSVGYHNNFPL